MASRGLEGGAGAGGGGNLDLKCSQGVCHCFLLIFHTDGRDNPVTAKCVWQPERLVALIWFQAASWIEWAVL